METAAGQSPRDSTLDVSPANLPLPASSAFPLPSSTVCGWYHPRVIHGKPLALALENSAFTSTFRQRADLHFKAKVRQLDLSNHSSSWESDS